MGKGNSSDVYYCNIFDIDIERRQFKATLQPTGASSLYIPSEGLEVLFLMVMWERLPFNIRYREIIRDDILTPEEKEIKKKIGSFGYNSMDITQFVWDRVKNMSATEREKFKSFEEWKKLTPEERQPYLDLDQKKRQHSREMMIKAIKERDLPPLAELSVEDICGDVGSFAWKYIQRVIKVKEEGYDENQLEKMSKKKREKAKVITGTYVVIVNDGKWLKGVGEGNEGTTADEQEPKLPIWSKKEHYYFPLTFRLRVKILLMMRLPRHSPNHIANLPESLFFHIISFLARFSYEEGEVQDWELKMTGKLKKLKSEEEEGEEVRSSTSKKSNKPPRKRAGKNK